MKDRESLLISAVIMIPVIVVISVLSVKAAKTNGTTHIIFGGRAELRNTIELSASDIDALEIMYGSKNVVFYPSDDDSIIIKEYLYSDKDEAKAKVDTVYNTLTGERTVSVIGGETFQLIIFGFYATGERIEVYLPKEGPDALLVQTGSGNIVAESGFEVNTKRFEAEAGSGNIVWHDTTSEDMHIQAGSGNIKLQKSVGNGNIQTGSGNILIEDFSGQGSVEAGSGNIKMEVKEIKGDLKLKTKSGNIRLILSGQPSFRFEAQTGSGNINTSFDDRLNYNRKGNQANGEVGENPSVLVSVEANSGNVYITAE